MEKIQAENFSVCDAHPNIEVFRLRLGKALNYQFYEDTQASQFRWRGPREGMVFLHIYLIFCIVSQNREGAATKLSSIFAFYTKSARYSPICS